MSMTMSHGGGRRAEGEGRVRVSCSWTTRQLDYDGDNIPIYLETVEAAHRPPSTVQTPPPPKPA